MRNHESLRQSISPKNQLPSSTQDDGSGVVVGVAAVDITPAGSVFLYGYPHVPRSSSGVHDPLMASAFYLNSRGKAVLFLSVDTIWLSKSLVADARNRIAEMCGLPADHVMITATHTHSGPVTVPILSNTGDAVVPPPDPDYLVALCDGVVSAGVSAIQSAEAAEITLVEASCPEIGGNRHDPVGPTVHDIPILAARARNDSKRWLGLMYVNRVHPTVLHEGSRLISGDFPGMCRKYLQNNLLGPASPVLSHLGAAGDQSPRYAARANTFEEAERLGATLGKSIESALVSATFDSSYSLACRTARVELPPRDLPTVETAEKKLLEAQRHLAEMKEHRAEPAVVRTAECAVFGAEETVSLATTASTGAFRSALASCLPAEIQTVTIGPWTFVGWPGEVFAEFALDVRKTHPQAHVITLANGELQGYLVTEEAVKNYTYEAANSIFSSPASGRLLVEATRELLNGTSAISVVAPLPGSRVEVSI